MLNNARREIVEKLYAARIASEERRIRTPDVKAPITFDQPAPYITASVTTREQYEACRKAGIREIYFDNIVRRNQNDYKDMEGKLLIGGYGGVYRYRGTNPFVTDYSFNVVNSVACYELHRLGAERVTLSYELNRTQIGDMIDAYYEANGGYPALEMIVYGRAPLLFTKYCPLRKMGLCGTCKSRQYEIRDEYGSFPILSHPDLANDNCATTILNGKFLNLLDEMPALADVKGIHAFRLNFTTETPTEIAKIVESAQRKLNGTLDRPLFNQETDTRGHFNKEII
jgi:putative protease